MKRIDVVIGIVVRQDQVLICQRRSQDLLGGYWEFPGGKQEPGETCEQTLARELAEELSIVARPIDALDVFEHDYPQIHVRLHPYLCQYVQGDPRPLASQQIAWVAPSQLCKYRFLPANDNLIRLLIQRLTFGSC